MRAFAFCALAVACASEKTVPAYDNWEDDALSMLQWKMRRVTDTMGAAEDGDGLGGRCDLLVIPRNASHQDCLLRVTAYIEKMGDRAEDLWIRRVKLSGQWLPQQYGFKTGSGVYGEEANYLVRMGTGDWKHPVDILQATDGLMSVAIHNKSNPSRNFEKSLAQEVSLVVGPVTVGVTYATSNKDNRNFNHLDVHLKGLTDVRQQLGGILAEQPSRQQPSEAEPSEAEPNEDEPSEDVPSEDVPSEDAPNEGQPNDVELNEGQPNEVELNEVQPNEVQPNEVQPNEGQPNEGQPNENEGQPNEVELNERQPNEGDELQLVQSSTRRSRNTIYKMLPSASSVKFDWCCVGGLCDACHWE